MRWPWKSSDPQTPSLPSKLPGIRYRIDCICGYHFEGKRQADFQSIRCVHCQTKHQVFPISPLALLAKIESQTSVSVALPKSHFWKTWRTPFLASTATALLLVSGFIAFFSWHSEPSAKQKVAPLTEPEIAGIQERDIEAMQALRDGAYREAGELFRAIEKQNRSNPELFALPATRRAIRIAPEAELLADLCTESISEMVQRFKGLSENNQRRVFQQRYAQRTIVLDTIVTRGDDGTCYLDFEEQIGTDPIHLEIQPPAFKNALKEIRSRRLIFAVRFQQIRFDSRKGWVVVLDGNSLRLLTEPTSLQSSSVALDSELINLLESQIPWLHLNPKIDFQFT